MNTAALRLATFRRKGFRKWGVTAYRNGNVLLAGINRKAPMGSQVRWPDGPHHMGGYLLPVRPGFLRTRGQIKAELRTWLANRATAI